MFGQATITYEGVEYTFTPTLKDIAGFERSGHNAFALAAKLSAGVVDAASLSLFMGDVVRRTACPAGSDDFYAIICGQRSDEHQKDLRNSLASVFEAIIPANAPRDKKKITPVAT